MSGDVRAAVWADRAVHERRSTRRYARVAERLEGAGWDVDLVERLRLASDDEARHADLCDTLAGTPSRDAPLAEATPERWSPTARAVYEGVVQGCIGETLNIVLLHGERELTDDPAHRAHLSGILRDEVGHSQLGWSLLMSAASRDCAKWLEPHLAPALERWLGYERRDEPRPGPDERLPFSVRRVRYQQTLANVVLPGFERAGVGTADARDWLASWVPTA